LAELEDRLALLDRLKRKYGPTLAETIAFGEDVRRKLAQMENKDEVLRDLHTKLAAAADEYKKAARSVSRKRTEGGRKLEKLVEEEINDLAMRASFHIAVEENEAEEHWTSSGINQVTYRIATNAGETMRPLEQIAPGVSFRVALALKASVSRRGNPEGKCSVARAPSPEKLRPARLSSTKFGIGAARRGASAGESPVQAHQVLCVTHLPQIATFADQHYLIEKRESAGRAKTTVRLITYRERTEEVARMLSGAKLTETSRKHAEQMIKANG
jgi:DNA repair protein RecN (Recombination protein N)